jgi:hypothetical protein
MHGIPYVHHSHIHRTEPLFTELHPVIAGVSHANIYIYSCLAYMYNIRASHRTLSQDILPIRLVAFVSMQIKRKSLPRIHGPDCVDYDTRRQVDDTKHHITCTYPRCG